MESELERIFKSEKKIRAASPAVLLFVGVTMFLFGLVTGFLGLVAFSLGFVADLDPGSFVGVNLCLILATLIFVAYYQTKQSKVNLELVKAIREIRERLDQGTKEERV